jgi:hypothetical protein
MNLQLCGREQSWQILTYCDMTPESQSRRSLLGNDSVSRFPRQRIRKQQWKYCWAIMMELVFSVGSATRLCNEDSRPAERHLRESLETAVEDD